MLFRSISNLCVTTCPTNYGQNDISHICEICANLSPKKYIVNGSSTCISEPTVPYKEINPSFGVIEYCFSTCLTCSGAGTSSIQNCLTCKQNYFLQPLSSSNCELTCPLTHGKDLSTHTCINCKSINQYKYPDSDYCTGSTTLPIGTYVNNLGTDSNYNLLSLFLSHF